MSATISPLLVIEDAVEGDDIVITCVVDDTELKQFGIFNGDWLCCSKRKPEDGETALALFNMWLVVGEYRSFSGRVKITPYTDVEPITARASSFEELLTILTVNPPSLCYEDGRLAICFND